MDPTTALVIIDVQAGMMEELGPSQVPALERIRSLLDRARAAGTPVVYVQHDGPSGDSLAPGSPGWPIHPAIAPREGEPVVRKRAADSFYQTRLREELEALGVTHLVVAGAQTELCVDTTCRRALSEGYDVTLAADAHMTFDGEDRTAAQIIAYHNAVLGGLPHPDHEVTVRRVDEIAF